MKNADTAVDYVIYLDSFALSLKVEGLRPHTISCYLRDVRRLGECSGWVTPASLTAKAEVAVQDYGSSLYVYLMLSGVQWDANWAKRMHFQAFRWSLSRAVEDALDQLPGNPKVSNIQDIPEKSTV